MIKIIGKRGCGSCDMTKLVLTNQNVEFEYYELTSLPANKRKEYVDIARKADNMGLPIIIKDGKSVKLSEVV